MKDYLVIEVDEECYNLIIDFARAESEDKVREEYGGSYASVYVLEIDERAKGVLKDLFEKLNKLPEWFISHP